MSQMIQLNLVPQLGSTFKAVNLFMSMHHTEMFNAHSSLLFNKTLNSQGCKMTTIRNVNLGDTLEIKKLSQVSGHNKDILFLTNHTDHPNSQYPKTTDTTRIVRPGTKVAVIAKGKPQTKYKQSYITVVHNNLTFDIFASDIRRFCK